MSSRKHKRAAHAKTIAEMECCAVPLVIREDREIRGECGSDTSHGFLLNLRIVAETSQPMDLRLAAKPGHLAFGIVAVSLLSGLERLLARQFAAKKLQRLLVAE